MKGSKLLLMGLLLAASPAIPALVATDPTGDFLNGGSHLDITNLYVNDLTSTVELAMDLNGDIIATDWGKYCFFVETDNAVNPAGAGGNGWARPINADGTNLNPKYWVATWVDGGGGAQLWGYTGTGTDGGTGNNWTELANTGSGLSLNIAANTVTVTVPKSLLGAPGTIQVAGLSTGGGGGDTAQDVVPNYTGAAPVDTWGGLVTVDQASSSVTLPVELDSFVID